MTDKKEETDCPKKYPLVKVRGLLLPATPFLSVKNVEDVIDFKPRDTDIFVVTYPKCGTTWAQYIVWEILHKGAVPPSPNRMLVREFPFLEFIGIKISDEIPPPRIMKTHLPFHLQPYNPKSKYIYVVRNPWDCCVSYFFYLKMDTTLPHVTFDDHLELFIKGEVGWGDFFDHVLSWFQHRNDPNVLFLTFENMKKDKKKSFLEIAKFLGESYYNDLMDDQVMEDCLKHTDFKYMKEMGMFFPNMMTGNSDITESMRKFAEVDRSTANPEGFKEINFFRKGEVGDWKNHFSPNHIKKFNEYVTRKLANTDMEKFWNLQPEETYCPKKYPLVEIHGLPFPSAPFLSVKNVEDVINLKPQDTDIFVVTYPKCDTTWTQFIVWEILHKGAVPPSPNRMMSREFPFLEFIGTQNLDDMPPPRTMKTHLPFQLQPYNPKTKYIYVVRNPWDCCVSYFHHLKMDTTMPQLTFDEFFEVFIKGEVGWGDFFDHVLSWFKHRNDPNVLFLTYEDMKKDKKKSLLKIAEFLGESYYNDLKDDQVMENCLKHTDFKYMKELGMFLPNMMTGNPDIAEFMSKFGEVDRSTANPEEFKEIDFFRKGEVGDWKNHFSPNHIKKFNEYVTRKLANTDMEKFWKLQPEETCL